jgi:hypothetical protein
MPKMLKMMNLNEDSHEIIKKYFPHGTFSKWVEDQLREFAKHKMVMETKPLTSEQKQILNNQLDKAINAVFYTDWNPRFAKTWAETLTQLGYPITTDELIEYAKKMVKEYPYKYRG